MAQAPWECKACTYLNAPSRRFDLFHTHGLAQLEKSVVNELRVCEMCSTPRAGEKVDAPPRSMASQNEPRLSGVANEFATAMRQGKGMVLRQIQEDSMKGMEFCNQHEYTRGIALLERAISKARENGMNELIAHLSQDLGCAYYYVGQYEKAYACHEARLALARAAKDHEGSEIVFFCFCVSFRFVRSVPFVSFSMHAIL